MMSSGVNLVMTVIGFAVSTLFIVFVCTRLIWARIYLSASRRSVAMSSRSDVGMLERGLHCLEPLEVSKFPVKKYGELCLSSKENALCAVCLSEYHNDDILRILPVCGHSFHATCIDIWLHQHLTCPICRISLRELPGRRWYMQQMFSSAIRSQHTLQSIYAHQCDCMLHEHRCSPRSNETRIRGPIRELGGPDARDGGTVLTELGRVDKDLEILKVESPSNE
ncbi:hypothetical protein F511_06772 [Dorcoceras hygrometricum]|uniref:RING-type domain-containing protein n=1 Tax=Dorcoceras hygrometricum TaxID=472368 RepID=A0A2Z7D786_9LAMI|nr:hypothetical protein F511_06772 [Dorcoceras hygrometricum]